VLVEQLVAGEGGRVEVEICTRRLLFWREGRPAGTQRHGPLAETRPRTLGDNFVHEEAVFDALRIPTATNACLPAKVCQTVQERRAGIGRLDLEGRHLHPHAGPFRGIGASEDLALALATRVAAWIVFWKRELLVKAGLEVPGRFVGPVYRLDHAQQFGLIRDEIFICRARLSARRVVVVWLLARIRVDALHGDQPGLGIASKGHPAAIASSPPLLDVASARSTNEHDENLGSMRRNCWFYHNSRLLAGCC
jgi:hypothetical protein